jgi:hypothetical protein
VAGRPSSKTPRRSGLESGSISFQCYDLCPTSGFRFATEWNDAGFRLSPEWFEKAGRGIGIRRVARFSQASLIIFRTYSLSYNIGYKDRGRSTTVRRDSVFSDSIWIFSY